ncbi:hypothetical protein COLO4_28242 [Corchorus olitorius]|uniref:Uncharacterized protein n=1 Tax=Corchorus olitorius TaxID=93759 RepID=A0A1R3HM49_9ROSI|nr:hypothetical protein COLO4_28242 [Corchorus olitorius]
MLPKDAKETSKIIGEKSENHLALRSGLLIPKDGVEPPQEQAYSFHHVMAQLEEMMGKLKTMEDKQENLVIEQRRIDAAIQRIGVAPRGQGLAPVGQLPRPHDESSFGVVNVQERQQKAKGIARSVEEMPPPKERRPSIPVRNGYINRAVPSRGQVSQPMAPRPVALTGSMPRRKLDLTTTEDMPMKVPNRSVTWKTVQRKLDFSSEGAKPSMMITSTVQGTSKPMMTRSKITPSAPHVLKPKVQFPTRSRSDLRPWLEKRKKEIRTMAIENEVMIQRDHAIEFNRLKMVRPTVRAPIGFWQKVCILSFQIHNTEKQEDMEKES